MQISFCIEATSVGFLSSEYNKPTWSFGTYNGRMEIFGWILKAEFAVFLEQDQRDKSQSAFILMVTEDSSNEGT